MPDLQSLTQACRAALAEAGADLTAERHEVAATLFRRLQGEVLGAWFSGDLVEKAAPIAEPPSLAFDDDDDDDDENDALVDEFASPDMIQRARDHLGELGELGVELDIDMGDATPITEGDGGCWVACWVWVAS